MPIYAYKCKNCGKAIETIHKMTESPKLKCEECGALMVRQIQLTNFELKGTGWPSQDIKRGK